MAKLLDVPNEHKQVYMEKANQAPPSFILSALNVLNQCELEYKNAGNKRLHVEMCLIRLCYLQQAIKGNSIGSSDSGETEVKKNFNRVDEPQLIIKEDATPDQQVAQKPVIDSPTRVTIQDKPIPAQDTTVVAPPPTSNSRRLSKNLLNDLEDAQDAEANRVEVLLTQEIVTNIVEEFIQQLRAEQKNIPVTHFIQIRPEFHPPDELKLVCPTEMVSFSARNNRSLLQELFKLRINKMVRVTVEIQEDETLHVAQTKVLSKSEMFEYMIAKNPLLLKLKEVAGLQLEY
jgi:DNA polymerase-3 subunit gamma/tau